MIMYRQHSDLCTTADMILQSEKLYDLIEHLECDGNELYGSLNKNLWAGNTYNGKILAIPNQYGGLGGAYVAINKDIVTSKLTEARIDRLIEEADESITADAPIVRDLSLSQIAPSFGYEYYYGTMIDVETGETYFPFEIEEIKDLYDTLRDLKKDGRLVRLIVIIERNF